MQTLLTGATGISPIEARTAIDLLDTAMEASVFPDDAPVLGVSHLVAKEFSLVNGGDMFYALRWYPQSGLQVQVYDDNHDERDARPARIAYAAERLGMLTALATSEGLPRATYSRGMQMEMDTRDDEPLPNIALGAAKLAVNAITEYDNWQKVPSFERWTATLFRRMPRGEMYRHTLDIAVGNGDPVVTQYIEVAEAGGRMASAASAPEAEWQALREKHGAMLGGLTLDGVRQLVGATRKPETRAALAKLLFTVPTPTVA